MSRQNSVLGKEAHFLQQVPVTPLWNETMAFIFDDSENLLTGMVYLGRWWGDPTIFRAMIALALPDDRALFMRSYGRDESQNPPSIAGLRISPCSDGMIGLSYKGAIEARRQSDVAKNGFGYGPTLRAEFDLRFDPVSPVWEMHANPDAQTGSDPMSPEGHKEQIGSVSGTLLIGDEAIVIRSAYCIRDHSRGRRDYDGHHAHVWLNGWFKSGWGFAALAAEVGNPRTPFSKGVLFSGDQIIAVEVRTNGLAAYGRNVWKPFELELRSEAHTKLIHVTRIWNCIPLAMISPADPQWGVPTGAGEANSTWALEQSVALECDQEEGAGHLERTDRDVLPDAHWRAMFDRDPLRRFLRSE